FVAIRPHPLTRSIRPNPNRCAHHGYPSWGRFRCPCRPVIISRGCAVAIGARLDRARDSSVVTPARPPRAELEDAADEQEYEYEYVEAQLEPQGEDRGCVAPEERQSHAQEESDRRGPEPLSAIHHISLHRRL